MDDTAVLLELPGGVVYVIDSGYCDGCGKDDQVVVEFATNVEKQEDGNYCKECLRAVTDALKEVY